MSEEQNNNAENGLPVNTILEILQTVNHPDLAKLGPEEWYRIENCMREDMKTQMIPIFVKDAITYHSTTLTIKGQEYYIREMQFADTINLANVGPQIIQKFFGGDYATAARMNHMELASTVLARALEDRIAATMSTLAYRIIDLLANLIIDPRTNEYMDAQFLFGLRPEVAMETIRKVVEVEADFFTYIQQSLPENMRGGLSLFTGMITGNMPTKDHLTSLMASAMRQRTA